MHLQMSCKFWSERLWLGSLCLKARPTGIKTPVCTEFEGPLFQSGCQGTVCLPLTPKVSFNFGVGWCSCFIVGEACEGNVSSSAGDCGDTEEHLSHNSERWKSKINAQAAEITAVKTELNKALEENMK